MSAVEDIVAQLPVEQLAARLGTDDGTARRAAVAVAGALIGGLQHNAGQGQEQAIAGALADHGGLLSNGGVDLGAIDATDGSKIVAHVFGDQSDGLAQAIGQRTGVGGDLVARLLPVLAPVVLSYLASRLRGGASGDLLSGILSSIGTGSGSSGLADLLGSLMNGTGLGSLPGAAVAAETEPAAEPEPAGEPEPADTAEPEPVQEQEQAPQAPETPSGIVDEIFAKIFGDR